MLRNPIISPYERLSIEIEKRKDTKTDDQKTSGIAENIIPSPLFPCFHFLLFHSHLLLLILRFLLCRIRSSCHRITQTVPPPNVSIHPAVRPGVR